MENMEIKEMLNGDKAEELFNCEAVLLDDRDAIPATRAEELLGVDAVACVKLYANKRGGKDEAGSWLLRSWVGLDGKTGVKFLTWPGFSLAVSYHNVFLQGERENPGKSAET